MGIKRSKQYRKLMQKYAITFGFREPYQVLLDADIIRDADRFKMDLVGGLERTLQGKVKPMITQCSMRHLYAAAKEPGVSYLIDKAKTYERRRCGHKPEDYTDPLSTEECLASVVDPKGSESNKNCYVVASQALDVRRMMRRKKGVPLIYINKSVMIMEPMADATRAERRREELGKLRVGLKKGVGGGEKRKREDEEEDGEGEGEGDGKKPKKAKKAKQYGFHVVKGPNPLTMKKPKKMKVDGEGATSTSTVKDNEGNHEIQVSHPSTTDAAESETKKKRKRKPKSKSAAASGAGDGEAIAVADGEE